MMSGICFKKRKRKCCKSLKTIHLRDKTMRLVLIVQLYHSCYFYVCLKFFVKKESVLKEQTPKDLFMCLECLPLI